MHMDKPGCSKRTRNSSSDSEDKITQDSKRERSDVSDRSGSTMGSVTEDTMSDLNSKLESIIEGQDKLRRDINENFIRHTKSMATLIDQKMSALRQEIDGKLQAMGQELQGVRDRVATMEAAQHDREAADGVALTGLQQRIDSLESKVSDAAEPLHEPARSKLIVKGLRESDSENERELLQQFEDLLSRLGVQVRAIAAVRVGSSTRGRKPRPVSFTMANEEAAKEVMRNKRHLKDIPDYSAVYIEPDRPGQVRAMEANIRRLTKELPGVTYRRGRVVNSENSAPADQ